MRVSLFNRRPTAGTTMRTTHHRLPMWAGVMVVGSLISACGESPISPAVDRLAPSDVLSSVSAQNGTEITVWDDSRIALRWMLPIGRSGEGMAS